MVMVPFDRNKARAEILETFYPMLADPAILASSEAHIACLRAMSSSLAEPLKPTAAQLSTPHYYGVDMLASPSLRDRLVSVGPEVAQRFVTELGCCGGALEDVGQLIIWGEDAINEMAWEFSRQLLERWGWLLGREWVVRANFWRRQRGAGLLPEW